MKIGFKRLQEFIDIPENKREEYIVNMKEQEDANKIMLQIINLYNFMK